MTSIIFAHSDIPKYLFQLRNFDVPLMVFVSGYSAFNFSSKSRDLSAYVTDRFVRLVVPLWIFLTLYFVVREAMGDGVPYGDVIESYLMTGGPVGGWIIRVFFFMSLLTPLMVGLARREGNHFLFLVLILAANEVVSLYFKELPRPRTIPVRLVFIFLLYNCSYGCVLYIGALWGKLKNNTRLLFTALCILCFSSMAVWFIHANGKFAWTQAFKNPPTLYYLSYALMICAILFLIKDSRPIRAASRNRFTTFIGSHTLWIYLWHWLFLFVYDMHFPSLEVWGYKFLFTFIGSTLTTFVQVKIVQKLAPMAPPGWQGVLRKMFMG